MELTFEIGDVVIKIKAAILSVVCLLLCSVAGFSQQKSSEVSIAPNAPPDKHVEVTVDEVHRIEEAIKPHIEKAKQSYPEAKKRFVQGLPAKHSFFVTTRLSDKAGKVEQVFVAVQEIKNGIIKGRIWSDVTLLTEYKHGDPYSFPEAELIDWTITKPDGTEEGNFVGKFLDEYQKQ